MDGQWAPMTLDDSHKPTKTWALRRYPVEGKHDDDSQRSAAYPTV